MTLPAPQIDNRALDKFLGALADLLVDIHERQDREQRPEDGYEEIETPYGRSVSVKNAEQLHRKIAGVVIRNPAPMSGKELRFIRKQLELSQAKLADICGVEEQTIRNWEKRRKLPKLADRYVKTLYREQVLKDRTPVALVIRQVRKAPQTSADHPAISWQRKNHKPWNLTQDAA